MNRRRFLETMLCGLGAAVAVRKFPFSVYSFPKEIKPLIYGRWEYRGDWLYFHPIPVSCYRELGYDIAYDQEMGVIQFFAKRPGNIRYSTEISLAEAKRRYPMHWRGSVSDVPDRLPGPRLNPFSQVFPNPSAL